MQLTLARAAPLFPSRPRRQDALTCRFCRSARVASRLHLQPLSVREARRPRVAQLAKEYQARGVGVVAINSNDCEHYTDDSPAKMKQEIVARGYTFPYLIDESQDVAKAYRAACTPDFYLFDGDQKLVYRGQMDSRPGNSVPVTGEDLRARWTPFWRAGPSRPSSGPAWVATSSGGQARNPNILADAATWR